MVTLAGHALPALGVLVLWFASTALVVWLANRARATFRRSLIGGSIVGIAGMAMVAATAHDGSAAAAYVSFVGGLLVWAWHELAFLTGAVAGPRREPSDPALRGWRRFTQASATLIHHELALAATMLLLLAMTFGTANPTGALAFALLFALRLTAKLNIFVGVPNFSDELLPAHLGYLKSYFRRRP
ncbi:MAG: putative photosynthetic complex assembly protein PuhE, partial [Sphingomonadaceae bacterium]|nr:putative photosynthetic complex assembly protein PuhE [Sphingomonadaceae bacterium]